MKFSMLVVCASLFALGCGDNPAPSTQKNTQAQDDVATQRAKLSQEDRALVEAQDLCPVSDERLGSMGAPIKLTIKEKPVFICCKACEKKALENPDKTLAKVEELKARKKN